MNRRTLGMLAGALAIASGTAVWAAGATVPAYVAAALSDASRPDADKARDGDRKPAEMIAFAGIKPGSKIGELIPGGGYFTRIFAKVVGAGGHVFTVTAPPSADAPPSAVSKIAAEPGYGNVSVHPQPFSTMALPEPVDVVWTSQNYHDLHLKRFNLDVVAVNKEVFKALKPGGYYVIVDHVAATGSPVEVADTLHRIDPAIVRREVEAAGFKYVGEDNALRNPADDHTKAVFDPAIRGHTDQFVYKFQKPK